MKVLQDFIDHNIQLLPIFSQEDSMGSGCFSPSLAEGQIDIEVLEQIYQDINENQAIGGQSSLYLQESSLTYRNIKQKIGKKGNLKKLCDYLAAHRFRICDNLMHNLRIVTQSKTTAYKYVAIILLDQLLGMAPQQSDPKQMGLSLKTIQTTKQSYVKDSHYFPSTSKQIVSAKRISTQSQNTDPNTSHILHEVISFRFEEIYFNLIVFLLKQNSEIYSLALNNLKKYVSLSKNSFHSVMAVNQIMKVMHESLIINSNVKTTLEVFEMMAKRSKHNFFAKHIEYFKTFVHLQIQNDEGSEEHKHQQISTRCLSICSLYMHNCLDSQEFHTIFSFFLQTMDQKQFSNVQPIQRFLFDLLYQNQLKNQYGRNLFSFFLSYIAFPHDEQLLSVWSTIYVGENAKQTRTHFKNILSTFCKENALAKISKWINYHLIMEIDELFSYIGNQLVHAYVMNLSLNSKKISNKVVTQIINLAGCLKKQHKMRLIALLIESFRQDFFEDEHKFTILAICSRIIQAQNEILLTEDVRDMFLSLDCNNCIDVNKKIMSFMMILCCRLRREYLGAFADRWCEFLTSISSVLKSVVVSSSQKVQILKYLRYLLPQVSRVEQFQGVLIAYIEHLAMVTTNQSSDFYLFGLFFQTLITLILEHLSLTHDQQALMLLATEGNPDDHFQSYILKQSINLKQIGLKGKAEQLHYQCQKYFQSHEHSVLHLAMSGFGGVRSILSNDGSAQKQEDRNLDEVLEILRN